MGNKPREVRSEKLLESFQNSNLQAVAGSHEMFQAVQSHQHQHQQHQHHGGPGAPPSMVSPHQPPPIVGSFARGSVDSGNLLGLLVHGAPQSSGGTGGTPSDHLLASLGGNVLGKDSSSGARDLQFSSDVAPVPKSSWTAQTRLAPTSLWVLPRSLEKPSLPLTGLGGGGVVMGGMGGCNGVSSPPKPVMVGKNERVYPQSNNRPQPHQPQPTGVWSSRNAAEPREQEKSVLTKNPHGLAMLRKPDKGLSSEAFGTGAESPSSKGGGQSRDVADLDAKMMDSSDCSDHDVEEQEEKNAGTSGQVGMGRATTRDGVSKNLISERKRRKKLNEGLYTLRSLVPKISKMDKASIIGDAIDYVRDLQKEVEELQSRISDLEESAVGEEVLSSAAESSGVQLCESRWDENSSKNSEEKGTEENFAELMAESVEQQILELDVSLMEDQIYHLQIFCTKGPGVFVQLMQSLEALGLEVLNANLTSLQDNILNTFIAEIKDWEMMKTEDVKKAIMDVASRFGLH